MVFRVSPFMWLLSPFTFSKNNTLGGLPVSIFCFIMFAILKNNVPLVSSKPRLSPATEKGWHGKPPQQTSNTGISVGSAFVMSSLKYK